MENKFLVPVVTPFKDDETVDYEALSRLVKKVLDDGADGIYASGSSAECFLLTEEERKKTLETVIKAADGAYVLAHVGNISAKNTLELCKHAKEAGANALSSVPPFYFSYPFEGIVKYYETIASVGLPIVLYSFPARTRNFSVEEYERLLSIDGVVGMKFTDKDYFTMQQIIAKTGVEIYSGSDECFLSALSMGAKGAIGTTFNYMMNKYINIYDLFSQNKMAEALAVQSTANTVTSATLPNLLSATKYMIELRHGIKCGNGRTPFLPQTEEHKKQLNELAYLILD